MAEKQKILIVDDDNNIAELISPVSHKANVSIPGSSMTRGSHDRF